VDHPVHVFQTKTHITRLLVIKIISNGSFLSDNLINMHDVSMSPWWSEYS